MIFLREAYDQVVEDILPLLEAHYAEVEWGQDKIPLNPDLAKYEDMIMSGDCAMFSIRDEHCKLYGYASFFLYEHPHHKGKYFASNDMLYVVPEHRGELVPNFIEYCAEMLGHEGCDVVNISLKAPHNHPELMKICGFDMTEVVYSKIIG